MLLTPQNASIITMTCVLLHNFLQKSTTSRPYRRIIDSSQENVNEQACPTFAIRSLPETSQRPLMHASQIREEFTEYFFINNSD